MMMTTPPPPLPVPDTSTASAEKLIRELQGAVRTARTGGQLYDDAANALRAVLASRDALAAREKALQQQYDGMIAAWEKQRQDMDALYKDYPALLQLYTDMASANDTGEMLLAWWKAVDAVVAVHRQAETPVVLDAPVSSAPTSTEAGL